MEHAARDCTFSAEEYLRVEATKLHQHLTVLGTDSRFLGPGLTHLRSVKTYTDKSFFKGLLFTVHQ